MISLKNTIKNIKKKFYCDKEKHNWEYYTAGNRVIEVDGKYVFADVPMRQCETCKRLEEKLFDNVFKERAYN